MLFLLLILIGWLLSIVFLANVGFAERVAYSLFFAVAGVPLVVINIAYLQPAFINTVLVGAVEVLFVAILIRPGLARLKEQSPPKTMPADIVALIGAAAVGAFLYSYYTNAEFLLSLASYLQRGIAKCFYMQTFSLIRELNPAALKPDISQIYGIISTPGNSLFTASLMPIFGQRTFHVLYVVFPVLLFLFVFFLLRRRTGGIVIPLLAGLFAALNPYMLSVEVLDRNVVALALSAVLLYMLLTEPDKALLHGLIFGVTAGTGLRFLHLALIAPVLILAVRGRKTWKYYAVFAVGFSAAFAYNIPHLFHHGFHSLGETTPFWKLLPSALASLSRTPFLPWPNAVYYFLTALGFFGIPICAMMLLGAARVLQKDRWEFLVWILFLLPTAIVLAGTRDWIESDKTRILLMGGLPLFLFLGAGLSSLIERKALRANAVMLPCAFAGLFLLGLGASRITGRTDGGTYERKPIYQRETPGFIGFYRDQIRRPNLLPDHRRLCWKTALTRKRAEEGIVAWSLFSKDGAALKGNKIVETWLPPASIVNPKDRPFSKDYINLRIDFDKLVTDMRAAAEVVEGAGDFFVNFEDKEHLLDINYKGCKVSWQPNLLPVAILTGKPEYTALHELNVDLNAFIGFGKDEYGFEKVNMINLYVNEKNRPFGFRTGMTALPQPDFFPTVVLRIPKDLTLIVRDWIVNAEQGVPDRIDSWKITIGKSGLPRVEFFPMEPESYL